MVVGEIISFLMQLDTTVLFLVLFGVMIIAFKVVTYLIRVFITGALFAVFPIVANIIGLPIPLTFESVIWSGIFGIVVYLAYTSLSMGLKIIRKIFSPFGKMFKEKPKQKIIIKESNEKD